MTNEEKQLLLKDICARLPYGVYVSDEKETFVLSVKSNVLTIIANDFKPYLRPMSSMTEDEKHDLLKFGSITTLSNGEVIDVACVGFERHADVQDYLNSHHFDYRGLIPMGLAIKATEGMYKTE